MVQCNIGDQARRGFHGIDSIEPAAQTDFKDQRVHACIREQDQRSERTELEIRQFFAIAYRLHALE